MFINNSGHMTKMAAMPIYGKNPSKIFFSETGGPISMKLGMKHLWEGGTNVYINNPGHMTKMAAMPIYGKNPSKIFFSGTGGPISMKLGMKH